VPDREDPHARIRTLDLECGLRSRR
jgi:hypothetical protein